MRNEIICDPQGNFQLRIAWFRDDLLDCCSQEFFLFFLNRCDESLHISLAFKRIVIHAEDLECFVVDNFNAHCTLWKLSDLEQVVIQSQLSCLTRELVVS